LRYFIDDCVHLKQLQRFPDDFYVQSNITLVPKKAHRINPMNKQVILHDNTTIKYDKLLIATGSRPIMPKEATGKEQVFSFYSLDDALKLKNIIDDVTHAVVAGAGMIGLQAADILSSRNIHVTVIEKSNHILNQMLPAELAEVIMSELRKQGVSFLLKDEIQHCGGSREMLTYIETKKGSRMEAQVALICCGTEPDIEIIEGAKAKRHHGILADNTLKTSLKDVWAAGSVVELEDLQNNQRMLLPYYEACYEMGDIAGTNMAKGHKVFIKHTSLYGTEIAKRPFHVIGDVTEDKGITVLEDIDRLKGTFIHVAFREDVVVGVAAFGRSIDPYAVQQVIETESPIKGNRRRLLLPKTDWHHLVRL
jgi:NAD(P)H-nitrite reductase large subunit